MPNSIDATFYDRLGYPLLETQGSSIGTIVDFASDYPWWKALFWKSYSGLKGDVPMQSKRLIKILSRKGNRKARKRINVK